MIRRHYRFIATTQEGLTAQGIITLRTWLPDPQRALDAALDRAAVELETKPEQLLCSQFHRC